MILEEVWAQARALRRRLRSHSDRAAGLAAAQFGLNGPGWGLLLRAQQAAPEPLSASRLGGWNPYVNPWTYEAGLQHLAALGLLAPEAGSAYALTPAGQSALRPILAAVYDQLCALQPQVSSAVERLAAQGQGLVAASLAAPEPPRKVLLRLSHGLAAPGQAHALVRLYQALSDLAVYRDDCHLAAWQPHMVSGPAWDALGTLWSGCAGTLDEIYGQLVRRGWPRDTYARALQELTRRDWVVGPEPYTLTPQGRVTRERAEAQTNRDFFPPWRGIEASALRELGATLTLVGESIPLG